MRKSRQTKKKKLIEFEVLELQIVNSIKIIYTVWSTVYPLKKPLLLVFCDITISGR